MKFTVAAPAVALLTASILALLTLLARINPSFMPHAYIVRIAESIETPPDDPTSDSTSSDAAKGNLPVLPSEQIGKPSASRLGEISAAPNIENGSSSMDQPGSTTGPTSPTHSSVIMDTPPKHIYAIGGNGRVREVTGDNAQSFSATLKRVLAAGDNDHVPIYVRSDPGDNNSDTTEADYAFKPYTLHFLTNCQWSFNNETAENCTKPWDFLGYTLESDLLEEDDDDQHFRSLTLHSKRNADDEIEDEKRYENNAHRLIKNRDAFSKVHLTGCVFVGLSFLCTAISFFILPALGQWISVGNLVLATLAAIFLFTSSIFTAVMAKEIRSFMKNEEGMEGITAKPAMLAWAYETVRAWKNRDNSGDNSIHLRNLNRN